MAMPTGHELTKMPMAVAISLTGEPVGDHLRHQHIHEDAADTSDNAPADLAWVGLWLSP